jgi:ATP-dependent RNA helicase DHX40
VGAGNATVVVLHPSSAYFEDPSALDWAIFHQVVWTSKPFMRTVCPIEYEWVRYLLPKLRKVRRCCVLWRTPP